MECKVSSPFRSASRPCAKRRPCDALDSFGSNQSCNMIALHARPSTAASSTYLLQRYRQWARALLQMDPSCAPCRVKTQLSFVTSSLAVAASSQLRRTSSGSPSNCLRCRLRDVGRIRTIADCPLHRRGRGKAPPPRVCSFDSYYTSSLEHQVLWLEY